MDRIFSLPEALAQRHPGAVQNAGVRAVDTFGLLEGEWLVTRRFCDRRTGQRARFSGHLFVDRSQLREVGELTTVTGTFTSRRALRLTSVPGGSVRLWRPDGSLLYHLDLREGTWAATHACGCDRYTFRTEVRSAGAIEEHWQVRGPEKDYEAETTLTRAAGLGLCRDRAGAGRTPAS